MSKQASASSSIGFPGALTLIFIVLKLTHIIDWSWWWVLAPAWISAGLAAVIIGIALLVALVATVSKR